MDNEITVRKSTKGFNVYFPFSLKDSFRETFKTARWDAMGRCWKVGVRSEKKLHQWVDLVTPVLAELDKQDEELITEQEVESVQAELKEIQTRIDEKRQERQKYASCEKLAELKEQLKDAKAELLKETELANDKRLVAESMLNNVCDLSAINAAHKDMKEVWSLVHSDARQRTKLKDKFYNACRVLQNQNEKLMKLGFYSAGLSELSDMNLNRTDRDRPYSVSLSDIYDLRKIHEQEDG